MAADSTHDHGLLSGAARTAEAQFWELGVPRDRFIASVETFWSEPNKEMRFLARIWPPWPVSQPEDSLAPLAWRAVEVTPAGRCYLRAIDSTGTDPWHTGSGTDDRFWATRSTPPTARAKEAPPSPPAAELDPQRVTFPSGTVPSGAGRRRVILPAPERR